MNVFTITITITFNELLWSVWVKVLITHFVLRTLSIVVVYGNKLFAYVFWFIVNKIFVFILLVLRGGTLRHTLSEWYSTLFRLNYFFISYFYTFSYRSMSFKNIRFSIICFFFIKFSFLISIQKYSKN